MANNRIKGQSVEIQIVSGGVIQENLNDIQDFTINIQTELLNEGYLGETTNRKDEIFNGVSGSMSLHFEGQSILFFAKSIVDRATRQTPGLEINIKATLNFPDGTTPTVVIQDAFFGEIPLSFASRSDYGQVSLSFEASNFKFIAA